MPSTQSRLKILNVVGTRPNFIKIAPLTFEMKKCERIEQTLVHTGQHYDKSMNDVFFQSLNVPPPNFNLGVGGGTRLEQISRISESFEPILKKISPDLVLVVGDVNSTLACATTAKENGFKVVHVEAGLRSFDQEMPEEINRVATDRISDILFTTEEVAKFNLAREGIDEHKIHFVGNVMIDALVNHFSAIESSNAVTNHGLEKKEFFLLTLHRPSNVDSRENFSAILNSLEKISNRETIFFVAHPRTKKMIDQFGIKLPKRFTMAQALPYIDFLNLMMHAKAVFTDSGGVQEETTYLKIPCITLRRNTERPVTIERGTNVLAGSFDPADIAQSYHAALQKTSSVTSAPKYWDGRAAERIVNHLLKYS